MTSKDLNFHTWNSQVSQLEEINRVDNSTSFTLVFINKEINFCREQVTFSNSQVGRRGGVKTLDSKTFITLGSILCLIPLPGLKISKPWKLGQRRSGLMSPGPKDPLTHFLFHEGLGKVHSDDSPNLLTLKFKPWLLEFTLIINLLSFVYNLL